MDAVGANCHRLEALRVCCVRAVGGNAPYVTSLQPLAHCSQLSWLSFATDMSMNVETFATAVHLTQLHTLDLSRISMTERDRNELCALLKDVMRVEFFVPALDFQPNRFRFEEDPDEQ